MTNSKNKTQNVTTAQGVSRRSFMTAAAGGALAATAAPVFAQGKPQYRLRLQSFLGPGWDEWSILVPRFCDRVKTMSDGRVEITPFPPGSLVPTFEMLDAVGRGVIDMGYGAQLYWRGKFPFTQWSWGMPFMFNTVDEYEILWWESGMTELVRENFATAGVQFLGPIYSDEWGSTISRRPIRTLADFQGLKIRSGGMGAELWKQFGASIVMLPGEELYTGLSTGVIDAANWGSPYGNVATKLQEVCKFYTGPSILSCDAEDMFMSKAVYDKMPSDVQEIMVMATRSFALERYAYSTASSARAFRTLAEAGVEVIVLPDADVQTLREKTLELVETTAGDDPNTKKALDMIYKLRALLDQRPAGF